jgi:hypothetical protein
MGHQTCSVHSHTVTAFKTGAGGAITTYVDQMPEDTMTCLTLVATPQDVLEAQFNHLATVRVQPRQI